MTQPPITLVVARFNEDLDWIAELPSNIRVVVYNKGRLIESLAVLRRADLVVERENRGRETETYLHHLIHSSDSESEWTVFTQGDPFEHSPDFLKLLSRSSQWAPVQALTCQWLVGRQLPPASLVDREKDEWLGDAKVRTEFFSLFSLLPFKYPDPGMTAQADAFARRHGIESGMNLIEHFLQLVGLDHLASLAAAADFGRFGYGAIFAVHRDRRQAIPPNSLEILIDLAVTHHSYTCICERMWLHFFGQPFLRIEALQEAPVA